MIHAAGNLCVILLKRDRQNVKCLTKSGKTREKRRW